MVDELTKIRVEGRDPALLRIFAVGWRVKGSRHFSAEIGQIFYTLVVCLAILGGGQRTEQSAEAPLEQGRVFCRHQTADGCAMSLRHQKSSDTEICTKGRPREIALKPGQSWDSNISKAYAGSNVGENIVDLPLRGD